MRRLWERIKLLVTGRAKWCDAVTGVVLEEETLDWRTRWAIAGVHSANWRWVTKYGKQDCGCTINPITRRRVLIDMECRDHGAFFPLDCECCGACPCGAFGEDDDDD